MSLTEMRRAIETRRDSSGPSTDGDGEGESLDSIGEESTENTLPKSRAPPAQRGVKQTRSCIVELEVPEGASGKRKGTLTFSNTVGQLSRAGSSREGGGAPQRPLRRTAPTRAASCMQ